MHVIYTGELVRLRPFHNMEEWLAIQREPEFYMSPFWGPFNWPEPALRSSFSNEGQLGLDGSSSFAIERLDSGELIGIEDYGPLSNGRLATWLGTCIVARHQGLGFGREAKLLNLCFLFENFPLESVFADTTGEHSRARAGLEACGFSHCGDYRACHWKAGRLIDVPNFQVMRRDWERMEIRKKLKRG